MAQSSDLLHQNLETVGSDHTTLPSTLVAAATIAPTTGLTFVSGTTNVATITPPVTGAVMIGLVFTNATPGSLLTSGNIAIGTTTLVQNILTLLWYDPSSAKWYLNQSK